MFLSLKCDSRRTSSKKRRRRSSKDRLRTFSSSCMWLSSCSFQHNISAWFQLSSFNALSTVKIELTSSSCWNLKSCWIESSVLCDIFIIFEGCRIHWEKFKNRMTRKRSGIYMFSDFLLELKEEYSQCDKRSARVDQITNIVFDAQINNVLGACCCVLFQSQCSCSSAWARLYSRS